MLAKVRSASRSFHFPIWSIPIALLLLTILSYGLRALSLGFFWDDWPYLWFFHRLGPQGIIDAFSGDRPFLSFIYIVSLSLLGDSGQGWQIFGLLARWLCGLGLWWALAQAWPRSAHKAAWAAMLFTIYPGFTQQWIALIYGQAFLLFSALFFSIGLTLRLARRGGRRHAGWRIVGTALALSLSAFTMFSTEYFFGLELLRPILLWVLFSQQAAEEAPPVAGALRALLPRARKTLLWWAPYLALMLVFIFWRAVLHPSNAYELSTLQSAENSPLRALWSLGLAIVQDVITAGIGAWGQPLQILPGFLDQGAGLGLRLLAVIAFSGLLAWAYLARLRRPAAPTMPNPARQPEDRWAVEAMIVGALALLASGWPTWITGLPMRMGFPLDRYSLAMSVGVCIALAGLVDWLGKDLPRKTALLALMVALSTGFHFQHALTYEQDWAAVRSFFWQLTWRAPQLAPNTLLASVQMPFRYFEDDSLTAPLNWTYDPNGQGAQMPYLLYDLQVRHRSLPSLAAGRPIRRSFRATRFDGSTSQMLLFSYNPPGCLHVLDPRYDAALYALPDRLVRGMHASNPQAAILPGEAAASPPAIFGSEPRHRWCYYYEKASLARQQEDWQAIRSLSREARGAGFRPENPAEYLPFIEGFARLGMGADAMELTLEAEKADPALRPALCAVWKRAYTAAQLDGQYRDRLNQSWGCSIP